MSFDRVDGVGKPMSDDAKRIERLEQAVAALAAFVSTMPGAPMAEQDTAKERLNRVLNAIHDGNPDQFNELIAIGPSRGSFRRGGEHNP